MAKCTCSDLTVGRHYRIVGPMPPEASEYDLYFDGDQMWARNRNSRYAPMIPAEEFYQGIIDNYPGVIEVHDGR